MLVLFIALGKIVGFSYENAAFWHANSFMVIHFYGNESEGQSSQSDLCSSKVVIIQSGARDISPLWLRLGNLICCLFRNLDSTVCVCVFLR